MLHIALIWLAVLYANQRVYLLTIYLLEHFSPLRCKTTTICRSVWRCARPRPIWPSANENNEKTPSNWQKTKYCELQKESEGSEHRRQNGRHFMQNTAIIYEKKLDYLSARHDEKGNKVLHIDTLTSVNDIESRLDDKMVPMPCSIKSLNKRMNSVCSTFLPLHRRHTSVNFISEYRPKNWQIIFHRCVVLLFVSSFYFENTICVTAWKMSDMVLWKIFSSWWLCSFLFWPCNFRLPCATFFRMSHLPTEWMYQ